MKETITISVKEYKELKERDEYLLFLESCGVDNCSGMSFDEWKEQNA